MHYLLFAAYLVLFAWLVTKVRFFTGSGFTNSQIVILFLLKVMAGVFYGWVGVYYGQLAQMIDTWAYHLDGLQEYTLLTSHPVRFFTSIFHTEYRSGFSDFLSSHSWWNDVKAIFFIKIMAIFDLFSFGNYYINVIFYSFLTLFGPVAVYRVMKDQFPQQKTAVLFAIFLVPSFLYWASGLHKEGLIFLGLSLILYHLYFGFRDHHFPIRRLLLILLGFILVLILRNFLILPLLPALIAWFLSRRRSVRPLLVFGAVYIIVLALMFTTKYVDPALDIPKSVVVKRQEFIDLVGNSSVSVNELKPTFASFLYNAPQALSLAALRPYPSDVRHLLSLAAATETTLILVFFLLFLFCRRKRTGAISPFLWFCLFFSFGVLFMIGYSVNNLGAIVRYRCVVFPLLLSPMAANVDWKRIYQFFTRNIKNNNNT